MSEQRRIVLLRFLVGKVEISEFSGKTVNKAEDNENSLSAK